MSKILFRSPYKTTGSGQPPRSVYGENMPRTLLRRHDKHQARAGVLQQRRRREVLTAIIVIIIILGGDIAARRLWHKAGQAPLKSAGTSSETREWQAMQWAPISVTPYRPAVGTTR